jgi:ubiquinone/menaquinone biosynthesis C-methylase UbiE
MLQTGEAVSVRRFRALARNWEALGDIDPLFGVLSDPTKYGGKWDVDEFFASGRAHVQKLLRTLDDARATYERGACLDFGCGVGRLTFALAESFARTVGVDVARPMIATARRYARPGDGCEFVLNRDPDLRQFPDATFDMVHSCLALQHIPPQISLRYVGEFFRVCRPGGLVVFQLPAETRSEDVVSAMHALPETAYLARLEIASPPVSLEASASRTIQVLATNQSTTAWPHDIPAGRHICVGNHWLRGNGTIAIYDDARALLPRRVEPGATVSVPLRVQAPIDPGDYVLEIDLVQEHICWFAEKGSQTARAAISVVGASAGSRTAEDPDGPEAAAVPTSPAARDASKPSARAALLRRLWHHVRGARPTFEMHVVPRPEVEQTIRASGGTVVRAVDDNAAGAGWLSYTYICRHDRRTDR